MKRMLARRNRDRWVSPSEESSRDQQRRNPQFQSRPKGFEEASKLDRLSSEEGTSQMLGKRKRRDQQFTGFSHSSVKKSTPVLSQSRGPRKKTEPWSI